MAVCAVARVALLAEGVDRNPEEWGDIPLAFTSPSSRRAWIEIRWQPNAAHRCSVSPSSRRAWIEIYWKARSGRRTGVALLAEGVDRNKGHKLNLISVDVALLAEGVDRNILESPKWTQDRRRPPRGGRG